MEGDTHAHIYSHKIHIYSMYISLTKHFHIAFFMYKTFNSVFSLILVILF